MRGKLGNNLSIMGDKFYDYGKIYQSLTGYEEILGNKQVSSTYKENLIKHFESHFSEEELKKITSKDVQLNIHEIKRPELDSFLVGNSIARQIENRISYRRAIKMAIAAAMRMNAEGIKIQISGRLNGAEMARSESYKEGRIPLSTFRADIDYAIVEAHTTYGRLGIKVWIMKGEVYGKRELSPLVGMKKSSGNSKKDNTQRERKS